MTDEQRKKCVRWVDKIHNILTENDIYYSVWYDENYIKVSISWGDWKHDHLRCDYLLGNLGLTCADVIVTEEDGSDCYSAIHYYR